MIKKFSFIIVLSIGLLFTSGQTFATDIQPGDTVHFGGVEWIVLDPETGRVIWNDPDNNGNPFWKTRTFDDGNSNVWETSDVRADLNNNLINDLDFSDGSNPDAILNIDLITEDEYIQYATYYNGDILDFNDWSTTWLTKTASSGSSSWVRSVNSAGRMDVSGARNSRGVRPALNLESGIFESIPEISNLTSDQTDTTITLNWNNPDMYEVEKINIYKNDNLFTSLTNEEESYTFTGLDYSTSYDFKVTTVNNEGEESVGESITVKTDYIHLEEITIKGIEEFYNRIHLKWENPTQEGFEKVKIYEEGILIDEVYAPYNHYHFSDLKPETNYTLLLTSFYDPPGEESDGIEIHAKTAAVSEVEDLHVGALNYHAIKLIFTIPEMDGYEKANLYYEGIKVAETDEYGFFIEGFEPGKEHEFVIKTKTTDGYESQGIPITVETPEAPLIEDVSNVEVETTHERVDLSWAVPEYNPNFNFVRIYRKTLTEEQNPVSAFLFGKSVSANEGYDPLFETNGSYFNDLSVDPDSDYEYLLTTENTEGQESDGVTVLASTDPEPTPTMGGINETTNENGDYVFTWSSPTTGDVKVFVGGSEYTTVPASDGQVTIPKDDMQYTMFNNPDVQLQPISESGTEGVISKPSQTIGGIAMPFGVNDIVSGGMELIGLVAGFIILAFALIFAPRLINFIKKTLRTRRIKT
ncbi:hypothetical protein BKP35_18245 [Anaerobacillus arseniciselenatis]|uniref:Fibronectin type-III domain-containing protein n=1 Tax=Anaerobacillus arseniciselenatis TaxID=85682 RepID=A0A1S2L565_9BACI|nr:fibronectin type III domain-containing protein [Anaerobacillus arseniciselenatis]OIJ07628.1 hypothetical protein BKP35_18245 [Anaerobacillus arseniciselenatis]